MSRYVPLRYCAQVSPGQSPSSDSVSDLQDGLPFLQGNAEFGDLSPTPKSQCDAATRIALEGDILISVRAPVGALNVADRSYGIGRGLASIRADENHDARFIRFCLSAQTPILKSVATGSTFDAVSGEEIGDLRIPSPPLEDQRRIADFLDDQTTRINNIITARQRQTHLADEQAKSIVSERIQTLRDRSQNIAMRWLVNEVDQRVVGAPRDQLLAVSIHEGVVPRSTVSDQDGRADSLSGYKEVRRGDLVLNRMRAFQGGVGMARTNGVVSPDYAVLRTIPARLLPQYAEYLFRSQWMVSEMIKRLRGIGSSDLGSVRTPRINISDLKMISIPAPTNARQLEVVEELDSQLAGLTALKSLFQDQITAYASMRRSLISAAVSGEFDVTTADGSRVIV